MEDDAGREAVESVHQRHQNVGYAAAVMRQGEMVLSFTGVLADLEHEVPVTLETRFGTASIITGVALLKLYEAGAIDLDAPV